METQTRIGTGAAALIALIALWEPHLPLMYALPIYSFLGAITVWGFWPVVASLSLGHRSVWRIPLRSAAQICFERTEGRPAGDVIGVEFRNEDERISFLYSSFVARRIPLFGRTPPSRIARRIPEPALRNLTPVEGRSDLRRIAGNGQREYLDVYMLRPALWRHVRHLRRAQSMQDI